MEVKGHLIAGMGLGAPELQGYHNSKLQVTRLSELEEKKCRLQALLSSRQGELRHLCLLEAELTGKLSHDFPLEVGECPPPVQHRNGLLVSLEEEDQIQRRQIKTLFSGTIRRNIELDKNTLHKKRTVHRGCHTEETIKSESSSLSDSTQSQDNEDSSPSKVLAHRSLSHPRLSPGSPDSHICRKLSPLEMRGCHNYSFPRSDMSGGVSQKQWGFSPEVTQFVPLVPLKSSSSEHTSYPFNSLARRSNSSEALLDHASFPELVPRNGMHSRVGPYKSSESLTDDKIRQMYLGSPEKQLSGSKGQGYQHLSAGVRESSSSYNEIMMDYILGKQLKRPIQPQQHLSEGRIWPDFAAVPVSGTSSHCNGFSHSQIHLATAPPPYSPVFLLDHQAKHCRVKVTRTKSCGPFIPLQQKSLEPVLFSAYEPSFSTASSIPNLLSQQAEFPSAAVTFTHKSAPFSLPTPEDSTRSLHKALALEGLRDWYLRNALGYSAAAKGHDEFSLHATQQLVHQPQSFPLGPLYAPPQIPQSASFHGHTPQSRSVELSFYPEPFLSQETTKKKFASDHPAPGTLV